MVAAVYYYATAVDHAALLDYLGEPNKVILHPWPVIDSPARVLTRTEALAAEQVMIVHHELGQPSLIRQGHPALAEPTKAGVFNQLNWERLRPTGGQGLVDHLLAPDADNMLATSVVPAATSTSTTSGTSSRTPCTAARISAAANHSPSR